MEDHLTEKPRARRRRLTLKIATRRARRRAWERGTLEAPSPMRFASVSGFGCPCSAHRKGRPKIGTGCHSFEVRSAVALRRLNRRLAADLLSGRLDPEDSLPLTHRQSRRL